VSSLSGDLNTVGGAHALGDAFGNLYPRSLVLDNLLTESSSIINNSLFY
jgi:hypothetical protein